MTYAAPSIVVERIGWMGELTTAATIASKVRDMCRNGLQSCHNRHKSPSVAKKAYFTGLFSDSYSCRLVQE